MTADTGIRSRSMMISVLVHLALFLALYFMMLRIKIPPFGEAGGGGGVLVNIGYVDLASGTVQPMSSVTSVEPQPVKVNASPVDSKEKIATQDLESSVSADNSEKPKKPVVKKTTPVVTEKKVTEKPKAVDPRAIYKGKTNNSTSQGTSTSGTGDEVKPQGDPNSKYNGTAGSGTGPGSGTGTGGGNGSGHGKGDGIGDFDLVGRSIMRKPVINDVSQETGKVVVDIVVDKGGNVTGVSIGRGSTTSNSHLQELALKAARETKFSPSTKGQEIQRGSITIVFVVH